MKSIGLQNVKAFKDTGDIELVPITIFVGQNSCGKSSFIRFPVVLSQTFDNEASGICLHSNQPGTIDYGNFQDIVYQHQGDTFSFSFTEDYKKIYRNFGLGNIPKTDKTYMLRCTIAFTKVHNEKASEIEISRFVVEIDDELAFEIVQGEKPYICIKKAITKDQVMDVDTTIFFDSKLKLSLSRYYNPISDDVILKGIISTFYRNNRSVYNAAYSMLSDRFVYYVHEKEKIDNIDEKRYELSSEQKYLITKIYEITRQTFDIVVSLIRMLIADTYNMHYIGPFRNNPQRIYRLDESSRKKVGHSGEYASDMLINDYFDKGIITKSVSNWFKESFGYSICVRELRSGDFGSGYYQITLQEEKNHEERNIMDVGYGISQVLPIVIQLAEATTKIRQNSRYNEFFVIEQPELHLHPAAQAKLASLFTNAIDNESWRYRRMLVETHSEHFIRALQVMIADPKCFLTNKMVKIYYVNKDEITGSSIHEMEMTEEGQFKEEWPSGFFDKSFELSSALLRAIYMRNIDKE